jgi:adenylate cyclase
MRLPIDISYGTEKYPEKVARGLRVLNATAWGGSMLVLGFALYDLFNPKLWTLAGINVVTAVFLAAIPIWHRFGPLAAPIIYVVGAYTAIFGICSMLGTDSGMQMQYLAIAAGLVLVVGTERIGLIAAAAAAALGLIIALEILVPRDTGLLSPGDMLANFIACIVGTGLILLAIVFYAVREAARAQAAAEREYERSEALLANMLPPSVASRLKSATGSIIADKHNEASVLFADMAGSTARASETEPVQLVQFLNQIFTAFDQLVEHHGLEKIKTSGDGYVVVSGAPIARQDHAEALADLALDMRTAAENIRAWDGSPVPIRIGVASGPVVGGVLGTRKFFYDVWGDAVNVAARMETTGEPGKIQVAPELAARLRGSFVLEERGLIDVRGKGPMRTFFLVSRKQCERGPLLAAKS